jgi:hypothetical protein
MREIQGKTHITPQAQEPRLTDGTQSTNLQDDIMTYATVGKPGTLHCSHRWASHPLPAGMQ